MLEYAVMGGVAVAAYSVMNYMSTHNRLMALDERCNTAFADIDALLKHRHDLIPGLVQSLQSVVGREDRHLNMVWHAYNETLRAQTGGLRLKAEGQLTDTLNNLFSGLDRMQNMNVSGHVKELQTNFKDVENRITAARRFYNSTVEEHNATLRQFPGKMIAQRQRLSRREPFDLGVERVLMDEAVALSF